MTLSTRYNYFLRTKIFIFVAGAGNAVIGFFLLIVTDTLIKNDGIGLSIIPFLFFSILCLGGGLAMLFSVWNTLMLTFHVNDNILTIRRFNKKWVLKKNEFLVIDECERYMIIKPKVGRRFKVLRDNDDYDKFKNALIEFQRSSEN